MFDSSDYSKMLLRCETWYIEHSREIQLRGLFLPKAHTDRLQDGSRLCDEEQTK